MKEMTVVLDGPEVTAIYADQLEPFLDEFKRNGSSRASHVEQSTRHPAHWMVDFYPLRGGLFFVDGIGMPFKTRKAALKYEVDCLERYLKGDKNAIQNERAGC